MRHGASAMHGEVPDGLKFLAAEKISHDFAGGVVDDEPGGSFIEGMMGEEDDGFVENAVTQ